jgi:diketogulonate reductase-like aldo/keto reductase
MNLSVGDKSILNNGIKIPFLGLGAYLLTGVETINAIHWALEAGYRHIDTAKMYNNEKEVGAAVKSSGIPRSEIFVTTKLWNDEHGFDRAKKACYKSLERFGFDYIDLYLIHWPGGGRREETWKALESLYDEGVCKSIGVSNYTIDHLKGTLKIANIIPQVNQVEFSPFLYQSELLEFCTENKIQLEAYSPLGKGEILNNHGLKEIAKKYNKSTAQVLIRWCLQHKIVVIPKSANRNRIIENANVFDFEISMEDMNKLDSLNKNLRVTWNPEGVR